MNSAGTSCDGDGQDNPVETRMLAFDERCPYLPGRTATLEGFFTGRMDARLYRALMDHRFRRSGRFFYRPNCRGCQACEPLRVPVATFAPSRSQRRCWRRNQDIMLEVGRPELTQEKWELYRQYVARKHADESEKDMGALEEFLYHRVVDTLEFVYRAAGGRLIAVGICDLFADALSSVYCYYDVQEHRRGLGTFTALKEIEYARERGLGYYYLGFLVRSCPSMCYKELYRPHEVLEANQGWVAGDAAHGEHAATRQHREQIRRPG